MTMASRLPIRGTRSATSKGLKMALWAHPGHSDKDQVGQKDSEQESDQESEESTRPKDSSDAIWQTLDQHSAVLDRQSSLLDRMARNILGDEGDEESPPSKKRKEVEPPVEEANPSEQGDQEEAPKEPEDKWAQVQAAMRWQDDDEDDDDGPDISYHGVVKFFDRNEKLGLDLTEDSLKMVESALQTPVGPVREKEMMDPLLRQRNSQGLIVLHTNPEIWAKIKHHTKDIDFKLQKLQSMINKVIIPVIKVMKALKVKKDKDNFLSLCDAFSVMAMTSTSISSRRKEAIQKDLPLINCW